MKGDLTTTVAFLCAGALALATQLPARESNRAIKAATDAYLLPPPDQLVTMSLGHRAAMADVLWADLLVSQGLRLKERRRFALVVNYLDGINELDPTWRDPYRLADSLITLQAERAPKEEVIAARRILERGVKNHPNDAELAMVLGTFVGYLAPSSYIDDDPELADQWRRDGATYLARAAELAPKDENIVWQTIGSARIFANMGKIDRAVEMYSHVLATTEDPELRSTIESLIDSLGKEKRLGEREVAITQRRARKKVMEQLWHARYPGATLNQVLVLGFPRDSALCSGGSRSAYFDDPRCSHSWLEWAERAPLGGEATAVDAR